MKAVQASQSKKTAFKKAEETRTVKVKNKEPEFFTATDGATTEKKKTAAKGTTP